MRKFWSMALPFGKVACVVKGFAITLPSLLKESLPLGLVRNKTALGL